MGGRLRVTDEALLFFWKFLQKCLKVESPINLFACARQRRTPAPAAFEEEEEEGRRTRTRARSLRGGRSLCMALTSCTA